MKYHHACITSGLFIFLIIVGTVFSSHYLDETAYQIINSLEALPEESALAAEEVTVIRSYWEERRKILSFTISETMLDGISLLFDEILIAVENADNQEYQKATARLRRAVESMNQLEKISLENIF